MNTHSFSTRHFHYRIPRCAAFTLVALVALAWCSLAFCGKNSGSKALLEAVRKGNAEKAASLIARVSPVEAADALIYAAELGHLNVVQAMVANGADINGNEGHKSVNAAPSSNRMSEKKFEKETNLLHLEITLLFQKCLGGIEPPRTPLIAAVRAGNLELVKWLVEHGADLDLQGTACIFEDLQQVGSTSVFRRVDTPKVGNNALSEAILAGQVSIVKILLEHGADVSRRVVFRSAAFPGVRGFELGQGPILDDGSGRVYIDHGNHLRQGDNGLIYTDLKIDVQQELTVRELASRSIHPEIRLLASTIPDTPLHSATKNGQADLSDFLREHGGRDTTTPGPMSTRVPAVVIDFTIRDAALNGDLGWVQALLQANPVLVFSRDNDGNTPLHWAAFAGHKDVAELLLASKAEVNARDGHAWTPLHEAALGGHKDVAELLLASKADVDAKDNNGDTPLLTAAEGHKDVVRLLLASKADVNAKDNRGNTPLYVAARNGHKDVVELLLASKPEVNAKDNNGDTPLHAAARNGYKEVVELLLASRADVDAKDNNGDTPLHVAATKGYREVAELLLASKADVNARDGHAWTPLHEAALGGHKDVAELLLASKAEVNAKDNRGNTPLHVAERNGHKEVVELLLQHGGLE
jgi:ankyrin repeat protein